jgi:hypothetical protein
MGKCPCYFLPTMTTVLLLCGLIDQPLLAQSTNPGKRKLLPSRSAQPTASEDQGRKQPLPIVTKHTRLEIPFAVNRQAKQATEVQLYISVNQGRDWELYASEPGPQGKFDFRAPREGSYWFCSRTMDAQKRLWPRGDKQPELIITIDVTQPQVELTTTWTPDGQILLQWTIHDVNLQTQTLQLSGQAAGEQQWEAIPTGPVVATQPGTYQGSTRWQPNTASPVFTVQATVSDQAGNRTETQRQVTASESPLPRPPALPGITPEQATSNPASQPAAPLPSIPWPADNKNTLPSLTRHPAPDPGDVTPLMPATDPFPGTRPADTLPGKNLDEAPPTRFTTNPQRANISPIVPTIPDQSPFESSPPESSRRPKTASDNAITLPPGSVVRTSNSRYFQLAYELLKTDNPNPPDVQLWATADGGRTWKHWGNDPDGKSPFEVQVRYEGIFGFRIAVTDTQGPAHRPPARGDPADIWLRVDTTPPQTRIESATFGTGIQSGNLVIRWLVEDLALAARPISLSYREKETDPWTTIASQLTNNGTYAWPVSPRIPRSIYLRLDARDQAGNTGSYQHPIPVTLLGLAPRGRIQGVQPLASPGGDSIP